MKYLRRHPKELDFTLDEIAEVAFIAREIEKNEGETAVAIVEALLGSRLT